MGGAFLRHALRPAVLRALPRPRHRRRLGALFGKLGKTGLDQQVLQQMGDAVPPGKAGWFLLIGQMTEDKFLAAVAGYHAKLVRSNLTAEQGRSSSTPSALASTRSRLVSEPETRTGGRRPPVLCSPRRRQDHRRSSHPADHPFGRVAPQTSRAKGLRLARRAAHKAARRAFCEGGADRATNQLGVIPPDAELSRHDPDVKPWDECTADERGSTRA